MPDKSTSFLFDHFLLGEGTAYAHQKLLSRSHALTFSRSHALTLSRSYALTLSRSHCPIVLLSNCLTILLSRILTLMLLDDLTQPTLLLDEQRCKANILRMHQKAVDQHVLLRPHFKTHQSRIVGQWFRDQGVDKITVSSVGMARYFADDGWTDITIAFPVNIRQLEEISVLSSKVRLGILVLDVDTIDVLGKNLHHTISIWIKIDVGTHRTGLPPEDFQSLTDMMTKMTFYPHLVFEGFMAHAGHTYHSRSQTEVQDIYDQSLADMLDLKRQFNAQYPHLKVSLGDTPGASMVSRFGPVDELRPGNFVFYDLMQEQIGACTSEEIAVAMACPVVAVHPERRQWVIYGGAIHFSKDYITLEDGRKCFGRMVDQVDLSWTTGDKVQQPFLLSLSQEHGIVQCTDDNFDKCRPGDMSLWLPVHSCLTADAMGEYQTLEGRSIDHYRQHVFK